MKGNNTIELNEASVIEAVQLLLDRDAPGVGTVKSVAAHSDGTYNKSFVVKVERADGTGEPTTQR